MTNASQDHPIQHGSDDAVLDEKLRGILLQVAGDLQLRPDEDPEALLRQRLRDTRIELSEESIPGLAKRIPGLTDRSNGEMNPGAH
ncbi:MULTISPECIES: hypothetical protein [Rathayibacter]|jgi:hypothetical protein|uniref:Uncharacterized protein n=1 Tax=Rathayibacter caricis DSM 15933 TaxID=1328867 RepID=A0A2T4UX47_9MICO|nr:MULTISPECIES: hypothetical protein [Rathayibacter]KQQ11221.1 hypothetical protein ASF46_09825 [Rathayibacter sp. Leaf296]KQQ18405.1 hypothetical protein ASF48_18560 [Rathayibacter sp. Leaf299]MCJ1694231.1 hypothetical protein [Rathayibacter caricis]PTL74099.1 hypothetical protein C1I63_15475 [Rathayibacter caricis DSM 15933]